ncbi:MAG: VWA domain-containing protein [Pseudomonadota bacterium]
MRMMLLMTGLVLLTTCTQEGLVPVPPPDPGKLDNRLQVKGDFCTTDPDTLNYPVKVLFVVDQSGSLNAVDPPDVNGETQRLQAMVDAFEESIQGRRGVEVAVIAFGAATRVMTQRCDDYAPPGTNCVEGFTDDETTILGGIASASGSVSGGNTNYAATLSVVYRVLFDDMERLRQIDEDAAGNARYVVIFFSDGLGGLEVGNLDVWCPYGSDQCAANSQTCLERYGRFDPPPSLHCSLYEQLKQIMNLKRIHRIRSLEFHTLLLSAGITDLQVRTAARLFMRYVAEVGNGTFRDFENGEDINFLHIDTSSYKRQFKLHNLIITNKSAKPWSSAFIIDSDGDGLDDVSERLQGSDPFSLDTDGDGFNDLLEYQLRNSGRDPIDPADAACDLEVDRADDDIDGLRNCEERVIGSFSKKYDSDFDGVPDILEHRNDTYLTLDDLLSDVDFDGAPNGDEIRWHSDPHTNDSAHLSEEGYRYRVVQTGMKGNQLCYHYEVENIRLVTTDAPPGAERGWNEIGVYVTEVPLDEPDEIALFKQGCARAQFIEDRRFKLPASGELEIPADALWVPGATDTTLHCVMP